MGSIPKPVLLPPSPHHTLSSLTQIHSLDRASAISRRADASPCTAAEQHFSSMLAACWANMSSSPRSGVDARSRAMATKVGTATRGTRRMPSLLKSDS